MSRLDSVIRRLTAQRDCLGRALADAPPGPVLEIGLGNGRTYHHIREIAPEREVWAIDRALNAHPSSVPPEGRFLEGEAVAVIEGLARARGPLFALAHYDLGIGVEAEDAPLGEAVGAALPGVLIAGALVVTNRRFAGFESLPVPEDVPEGRYFIQRWAEGRTGRPA